MSSRQTRRDGVWGSILLVAANLVIPAAILIFATGFFPYKPLLPGLASFDAVTEYGEPPAAPFDKLVLMVIDALRSDFVYTANSGFQFTQSLIRDGIALPFTAHATSPTVTMPRLKAITTGSIPSFLDVVLNLDETDESSSLANQDTWLAQMRARRPGKLVMYGDDTWLKLFPGVFDRADGTSSFFVSDFTEVDNNVTRHIADELKRDDWNTMILHYLGLDHIGHKGGPRSPHMLPKQREMDAVIKQIYTAIESEDHLQSTLFIVCGDHGMNDAGNHGASSAGETSPALVFISPKLRTLKQDDRQSPLPENEDFQFYSTVEQSDLAPTLSALLGLPVPKNNLGALIPAFLPFWSEEDQVQLLMRNAHQLLDIVLTAFGAKSSDVDAGILEHSNADYQDLARGWHALVAQVAQYKDADDTARAELIQTITKWLRLAQRVLSSMASNYDIPRIFLGLCLAVFALLMAIFSSSILTVSTNLHRSLIPLFLILTTYAAMMFASSYIEEEHHFWYWSLTAWFTHLGLRAFRTATPSSRARAVLLTLTLLLTTRVVRAWIQTGVKHAAAPDVVKTFLHTNPPLLWTLVGITYAWTHQNLVYGLSGGLPPWLAFAVATGLVLAAFTFKVAFCLEDAPEMVTDFVKGLLRLGFSTPVDGTGLESIGLVTRARAVFIGLAAGVVLVVGFVLARRRISLDQSGTSTLLPFYTLLALTQSRPGTIPLYILFNLQYRLLSSLAFPSSFGSLGLSPIELSITLLLLQHASFFATGGSNSVASVDLSSAYNGVAAYSAPVVGVLTFVSNWAAVIWWSIAGITLLLETRVRLAQSRVRPGAVKGQENGVEKVKGIFRGHVAVRTVFVAGAAAAVMAACTLLRTHLFIWTVFSPKYLYTVTWSLGQHLVVDVGVAGLTYALGVWESRV